MLKKSAPMPCKILALLLNKGLYFFLIGYACNNNFVWLHFFCTIYLMAMAKNGYPCPRLLLLSPTTFKSSHTQSKLKVLLVVLQVPLSRDPFALHSCIYFNLSSILAVKMKVLLCIVSKLKTTNKAKRS